MLCYISEQGTLPGILMADLNVKHRAGSLCTVIFGRPLKFPPVVANRFQSGGVCLFSSRKFSPDKRAAIKLSEQIVSQNFATGFNKPKFETGDLLRSDVFFFFVNYEGKFAKTPVASRA